MGACDVAVIGAGIIGTSVGYELACRGASVTIVDDRTPGNGATQAAAGMLAPYIEGFGKPILPLATRSLGMYDDFVRRVSEDSGMSVEYHRDGSLQIITSDESADALVDFQAAASQAHVRCTQVDAAQIHDLDPFITPEALIGLLVPDQGVVVPTSLSRAIAAAAANKGAKFQKARVERLAKNDRDFLVETSGNSIRAGRVVLAAGSWSGHLPIAGLPPVPVRPVRGQLLHLIAPARSSRLVVWGTGCYIAPASGDSVAVGATMEEAGFDERVTVAAVRDLLGAAAELMPALWQSTFENARVGLRPATPDDMPILGPSLRMPGLFYATGHFRNGILLAPLTARIVADLVLDNREDAAFAATSPQRFGEY
jgi:glycine oxidase